MKKIFLLAAALAFAACSNDDKPAEEEPQVTDPPKETYLQSMKVNNGAEFVIDFSYNSQKQLVGIDSDNFTSGVMTYEGNRLKSIETSEGTTELVYEGGVLRYLVLNGQLTGVQYNNAQQIYTFEGLQYKARVNGFGDLSGSGYSVGGLDYFEYYGFDNAKKGPAFNLEQEGLFMVSVIFVMGPYLASRAATDYDDDPIVNTYNADGFVTKSVTGGNINLTVEYTYTQL